MKSEKPSYLGHLSSADDLITTYEATRAGFVALALEKNRRASPSIEQARTLKSSASRALTPRKLTQIEGIEAALLTASGISDKALKHLRQEDKNEAINGLIENFLEPAGKNFIEELVFRFLITKGDALGGTMRNIGGVLAQQKLSRIIIATLTNAGLPCLWLDSRNKSWVEYSEKEAGIETCLIGLSWRAKKRCRTLVFNINVPIVKSNVDMCLLNCLPYELDDSKTKAECYIALGELKGGIDPAGSDEHWKTARTSLSRINDAFSRLDFNPDLFFVGTAIVKKMGWEIWDQLESGILSNAANLTKPDQINSLCYWLCSK